MDLFFAGGKNLESSAVPLPRGRDDVENADNWSVSCMSDDTKSWHGSGNSYSF